MPSLPTPAISENFGCSSVSAASLITSIGTVSEVSARVGVAGAVVSSVKVRLEELELPAVSVSVTVTV